MDEQQQQQQRQYQRSMMSRGIQLPVGLNTEASAKLQKSNTFTDVQASEDSAKRAAKLEREKALAKPAPPPRPNASRIALADNLIHPPHATTDSIPDEHHSATQSDVPQGRMRSYTEHVSPAKPVFQQQQQQQQQQQAVRCSTLAQHQPTTTTTTTSPPIDANSNLAASAVATTTTTTTTTTKTKTTPTPTSTPGAANVPAKSSRDIDPSKRLNQTSKPLPPPVTPENKERIDKLKAWEEKQAQLLAKQREKDKESRRAALVAIDE
jgi:hypothetical protein